MQTEDRLSEGLQGNNLCGIFIEGSLLKTIFGREFRHLSVTAQKVLYGADTDLHGARPDVYIEPIYNIAGKCGPEYDPESVMQKLAEAEQSTNR